MDDLLAIGFSPDPWLRQRLLDRWLRQFTRPAWVFDLVMEAWITIEELDPEKHIGEDEAAAFDTLVKLTWLQRVFSEWGPVVHLVPA